jgi:acyl-CoA thioesterase-2
MSAIPEPAEGQDIVAVLGLERIADDLYRANHRARENRPLYGGQVAGQALAAAGATVPAERLPHSLHGYFLRPGDSNRPTVFRVERDRDGRSAAGLDHALWLNRSVALDDWVLVDLVGRALSAGRGL